MNTTELKEKPIRKWFVFGALVTLIAVGVAVAWSDTTDTQRVVSVESLATTCPSARQLDPFSDLIQIQRSMRRLFDDTMNPYIGLPEFAYGFNKDLQQSMDLVERLDAYIVQMDLPGIDKADIQIEVNDRLLTVSGERKISRKEKQDGKLLLQERGLSSFRREVMLPKSVNSDEVAAEYSNGVLTITLPKLDKGATPRKVEIK